MLRHHMGRDAGIDEERESADDHRSPLERGVGVSVGQHGEAERGDGDGRRCAEKSREALGLQHVTQNCKQRERRPPRRNLKISFPCTSAIGRAPLKEGVGRIGDEAGSDGAYPTSRAAWRRISINYWQIAGLLLDEEKCLGFMKSRTTYA